MSGEFEVKAGVLQGDTLAPFLFVTALGLTMVPGRSQWHPELEESIEKSQSQLDLLGLTAKEVGLQINTSKTKLITCNVPHASLQIDGEDVENVEDF